MNLAARPGTSVYGGAPTWLTQNPAWPWSLVLKTHPNQDAGFIQTYLTLEKYILPDLMSPIIKSDEIAFRRTLEVSFV